MHASVDCYSLVIYNTHNSHISDIHGVRSAAVHPGRTRFSSLVCQFCVNTCMCARCTACDLGFAVDSWESSEDIFAKILFTERHFALTHVLVALSCQQWQLPKPFQGLVRIDSA